MPDDSGAAEKVMCFMFGALVGAVTALLLAPRSGEETRRLIAGKAREGSDYLTSRGKEVVEKASGYVERGKEAIQQQKDQLSAALEAGKQAYKDEKVKT
jgi:gas vesicle protein